MLEKIETTQQELREELNALDNMLNEVLSILDIEQPPLCATKEPSTSIGRLGRFNVTQEATISMISDMKTKARIVRDALALDNTVPQPDVGRPVEGSGRIW